MALTTVVFNAATFVVSVVALSASVIVGRRQIRLSDGGNQLPVVLDAFRESRGPGWMPANEYVLNRATDMEGRSRRTVTTPAAV